MTIYIEQFFSKSIIENQYIDRSISIFEKKKLSKRRIFAKRKEIGLGVFICIIYTMIHHSSKSAKWFLQTSVPGFFAHRQTDKRTQKATFYLYAFCHVSFRLRTRFARSSNSTGDKHPSRATHKSLIQATE